MRPAPPFRITERQLTWTGPLAILVGQGSATGLVSRARLASLRDNA